MAFFVLNPPLRSRCELDEENVDGQYSVLLVVDKLVVESLTDNSEDQVVMDLSNTENEEEIIECMIVKYRDSSKELFL